MVDTYPNLQGIPGWERSLAQQTFTLQKYCAEIMQFAIDIPSRDADAQYGTGDESHSDEYRSTT
jgi:hypothetical protein